MDSDGIHFKVNDFFTLLGTNCYYLINGKLMEKVWVTIQHVLMDIPENCGGN